jgi:tetratricopeptide (TPR) repeat protein
MLKASRYIPLLLLTAGVITGGLYLAPSHQEIALMQMNDFDFSAAYRNFKTLHKEGDTSINVLAPLVNLNVYYGDIDKAIDLLNSFIEEHPSSVEARKRLAALYKSSERYQHYCDTLEQIQKLSPSEANLRELADVYAFLGRSREEMEALARLLIIFGSLHSIVSITRMTKLLMS